MEGLSHLVSESLARYGVSDALDHRRLRWSPWFRCASNFDVLLAPSKPGLFALSEEVVGPGNGKRILALFRVAETEDLGLTLGRLFLPGSTEQEKLSSGQCFARYAVVEDAAQRQTAFQALREWMTNSAETATGFGGDASAIGSLDNPAKTYP